MGKQDARTALRLPSNQREKINELVTQGKFKSISSLVRAALSEFLAEEEKT